MTHPLDDIAPLIAKWLAPYVAEELRRTPEPRPDLSTDYDTATCVEYLGGVGDVVLPRAEDFFRALDTKRAMGEAGLESRELAQLLEVESPRQIPSLLTNSLKRRAKALGLPYPWQESTTKDNRTVWSDRDGIAHRMIMELMDEHLRRTPEANWDHGRSPEIIAELSRKDVIE